MVAKYYSRNPLGACNWNQSFFLTREVLGNLHDVVICATCLPWDNAPLEKKNLRHDFYRAWKNMNLEMKKVTVVLQFLYINRSKQEELSSASRLHLNRRVQMICFPLMDGFKCPILFLMYKFVLNYREKITACKNYHFIQNKINLWIESKCYDARIR